jgi:hypothetical protein
MDLSHKTLYLLHDGDSYELVVDSKGTLLEIWRYDGNQTRRPEFCRLEWLDEILQDRIHDRIIRNTDIGVS